MKLLDREWTLDELDPVIYAIQQFKSGLKFASLVMRDGIALDVPEVDA